jgi:hypothetical protein
VIGTFAGTPFAGLIPVTLIVALWPLVAFSVLLGVAIVVESEFWAIVTMSIFNISYTFTWYFLIRIPGIRDNMKSAVPVWSDTVQGILASEIAVVILALGLTIWLQSKKRSFI